ncbi:hypothetical protein PRUPE_1G163900 [Prunus persica]|uniref:Uncharacterized protein n=1 Tax=Prunus persica TaxID=3760 RepID=A0A251QYA8_PRUPE|nr:hypothetical protein PRUPE_1G163900 [Prunus persica]
MHLTNLQIMTSTLFCCSEFFLNNPLILAFQSFEFLLGIQCIQHPRLFPVFWDCLPIFWLDFFIWLRW